MVSNIAEVDRKELLAAEEKNRSVTQIVEAFEEHLRNVEVKVESPLKIFKSNVAIQVISSTVFFFILNTEG